MDITTIVGLLPLISQQVQLIDGLNNFFHFDHNIFLLDSSAADIDRFVINGNHPRSVYVFDGGAGDDNVNGLNGLTVVESKNNFMIVVADSLQTFNGKTKLKNRIREIHQLDSNMKIGMFFRQYAAVGELRKLFQWCKRNVIAYVFVGMQVPGGEDGPLHIFSFHMFGTSDVRNVTIGGYGGFFPSLDFNFNQHQFRTPALEQSYDFDFWNNAFTMMNGTGIASERYDVNTVLNTIAGRRRKVLVYPFLLVSYKIVVPHAEPYSDFYSYLHTLTSNAFFGCSLGVIVAITFSLSICRYIDAKRIRIFQSLLDVLNLLINDNGSINYRRLSRAEVCIIGPLTFVGFVFVNGILSNLKSYVTRPFLQQQIRTVDDIYNSPSLMTIATEHTMTQKVFAAVTQQSNFTDWQGKIIEMDQQDFSRKVRIFDTSQSYALTHIEHAMLLNVQKQLNIRGYYKTGIQIYNELGTYVLNRDFLFFERLNEIIGWMQSAGLFNLWIEYLYLDCEMETRRIYREQLKEIEETNSDFDFLIFIVYGWGACAVGFVVEIIWKNFTTLCKKKSRCVELQNETGK